MDELLAQCNLIFDRCTQPFCVVSVAEDAETGSLRYLYEYLNPAMASLTHQTPSELEGKDMRDLWADAEGLWFPHFQEAALFGKSSEFEASSSVLKEYVRVSVFPILEGHCGFFLQLVNQWATKLRNLEERNSSRMNLLKQQKQALQTALDMAEQGSNAKTTFLTNISHDFRTPMNAITGFARIALEQADDQECVKDCLNKILVSSDHLLDLVNEILDLSHIESGKLVINAESMGLSGLLGTIASLFSEEAAKRGMVYSVDTSKIRHNDVMADSTRLSQILVNIIGNAFKFTPDGGKITVTATEETAPEGYGYFTFTVEDTGCGISPEMLDRLFEPFARSKNAVIANTEGTGLGMAITKSLVDLMDGTLEVESCEGKGSTFRVTLPLELDGNEEKGPQLLSTPVSSRAFADMPEMYDFSGRRALIADDDDLSREVLKRTLERYGFSVEDVADGEDAVQDIMAKDAGYYDVVMLDMRMPRMNGDDAAKRIRSLDRKDVRDLPILAVTADAFEDARITAERAGMSGRITKPLEINTLMQTLSQFLS